MRSVAKSISLCLVTLSSVMSVVLVHARASTLDEAALNKRVGEVVGKCCRAGRRWGCDPANFEQSGCVPIVGSTMNCIARTWAVMECSGATCVTSNPEHVCEVNIETVAHNECQPTGSQTTVGCPAEQWQCEVRKRDYTTPGNHTSDVLVCDFAISTPCVINYSHCD